MAVVDYAASEVLRDGRRLAVRALKPEDRDDLVAAVGRASPQSLYRRFFTAKRNFSEAEIAFFLNVDFVQHVALVALVEEDGVPAIVAGARYVVVAPGAAEVAFVVVDAYQGQGIGTVLMRHLVAIARAAGLTRLVASVLPGNAAMLKVFERCGLPVAVTRSSDVVEVEIKLA